VPVIEPDDAIQCAAPRKFAFGRFVMSRVTLNRL